MSYTREDWEAIEKTDKKNGQMAYEALAQAVVSADHVTSDPDWDRFLSYIQAAIEKQTVVVTSLHAALADPGMVNPDLLLETKIQLIRVQAWIDAYEEVIAIPRKLKYGVEALSNGH